MVTLTCHPETGAFTFETDEIKGVIQPNGAYHGVAQLLHKPTGVEVVHPKYSVLNLFFLFSVNLKIGVPRGWEREVSPEGNAVELRWAPNDEHLGELVARYEVKEPNLVDLTVTVRSQGIYRGYELFLSSYFDPSLCPHVCLVGSPYSRAPGEPQLVRLVVNEAFEGTGLVFARDAHAARLCVDGRWDRRERKMPTAQWCPVRYYAYPFGFQARLERGMAAVLMSRPQDCFAVISGYDTDNEDDPFKSQNPLYLSLFGRDLLPEEEYTAKVRLVVTPLDEAMSQPMAFYQAFIAEAGGEPDPGRTTK